MHIHAESVGAIRARAVCQVSGWPGARASGAEASELFSGREESLLSQRQQSRKVEASRRRRRWNASRGSHSRAPSSGAGACAAWTKATCWRSASCGGRSSPASAGTTPMWSCPTCAGRRTPPPPPPHHAPSMHNHHSRQTRCATPCTRLISRIGTFTDAPAV